MSEDSDGPGAAAGSERKGAEARKPAGAAGSPGAPATDETEEMAGPQPVPQPRTGRGPAESGEPAAGGADEHAEIERLRAEIRDLKKQSAGRSGGPPRKGRWRAPVSAVLIVLGCVLAPVSVLGVWAANQVSNTDRYVANMAPLISEPPIQQALSAKITHQITSQLDVQGLTAQAADQAQANHLTRLASLLKSFAGPISSGVDGAIASAVSRIVASPAVAAVWTQANRVAHAGVVRVLSGQGGGAVSVVNNEVVLNIGPLITQVKQQLVAQGLTIVEKLPTVNATFPLFEAPNLAKAQQGYRLIVTLRWVLPLLALVLLAVGIYIARRHRRALIGAALGLAASMLVLGIALTIARTIYLNSVPSSVLPSDAAAAAYDTLIRFVRQGLRVILVVALIIAAGAFLSGPSVTAVRSRRAVQSGIGWVRTRGEQAGVRTGPVGEWTGAHKTLLRAAAVAVAALVFVFWGHPTVPVVIWILVVLLVVLGLIELIGGRSGATPAGPQPAPPR